MTRTVVKAASIAAVAAVFAGAVVLAQAGVAQLGLTEAKGREYVRAGFGASTVSLDLPNDARKAFAKLPAAARGPAMTALYAWTRAYIGSAAFKADYADMRKRAMPQGTRYDATIDQEVKQEIDEQVANIEAALKQMLPTLPAAERAKFEAEMKQNIAELRKPETAAALRAQKQQERGASQQDDTTVTAQWQKDFPADPNIVVARHLREFLAATADVDFAAAGKMVPGEAGPFFSFDNAAYNKKPWQWHDCHALGREGTAAARAAAEAWLKELPPR